jgi:hypothetical protein
MNENRKPQINAALVEKLRNENKAFCEKSRKGLAELFETAKKNNQLHYALSLNPEFHGMSDAGWNSTDECFEAVNDYMSFMQSRKNDRLKVRVALAFYCHMAEASGFYEIPKNMLRVAGGEHHSTRPFRHLVEKHRITGEAIAPNANRVMKDLIGHCQNTGFQTLASCFGQLFDYDLRNGFAHADYVVWDDGIRLTRRNGGGPLLISYERFEASLERAFNFFLNLRELWNECLNEYNPPKTFRGFLATGPEQQCKVSFDSNRVFTIQIGGGPIART